MRRLSSLIVLYAGSLCLLIPEINVKAKESSESGCKTHKNASCSGHHGALKGYTLVPERLDFGSITIGEVALRYIQIHGKNSTIKLIRTVPVDMTMFYLLSTEVPQKGLSSCKLKLALVPKILGIIDTVLVVFTSFGEIPVPVRARISQSPFRIFPIEHPRIPVGANYSTDITLFNPFDEPLSIQRIYLSGGPFHLFLPDVVQLPVNQRFLPKPKGCWQIPPFESRIVASLFMDTLRSFREQAFLRVEFNNSVCDELFLPVDATVWQGDGLYSVDGILQFGVRRVMDNPLYLPLKVRLTDKSSTVHIEDIIDGTRNPGVAIDVMKRTVVDDEITVIANVSFNATMYKGNETVMGNIIIKAASSQLIVPYRAFVVSGELIPFKNSNFWLMPHGLGEATTETLIIKNIFASPVVVLKVLIRQNVAFSEIELVDPGFLVKIPPGQARHVVKFKVIVRSRITHSVKIQLVTNVGLFDISVTLYTGDLRIDLSEIMDILNDGIVVGESFQRGVSLYNTNPVLVVIHNITLASQCFGITRVYVCPAAGNCSKNISVISNTVLLKPSESVRVQLAVKGVVDEGLCPGKWSLNTEYQVTTVPLDTFVLGGRIEIYLPEAPLIIDGIYPSSIAQRNLTVFNTFHKAIEIVNIFSEELPSLRLMPNLDGIVISPRMGLSFDTLTFDARQLCKELSGLCYAGFDLETLSEKTETWKRPFRIINYSSVEIDRRIRERQRSLWTNVSEGHPYFQIDSTLTVTTTGVYKFYLPVSLRFVWPPPMISSTSEKLEFPLLSLGNSSELDVEVKNPADRPLFVHAYVFKDDESQVAWNRDIFYVKSIVPKGTTTGYYRVDDERLPPGLRFPTPPPGTAASIVPDRGTFLVKLAFQPQTETCYNAVLYIRNNLTVIETIHVHGCGVEPKLQISNDSTSALSTHLVIRFTGNDAIYCRNRSPDCSDRNEIRRSGKIVVTNVGGAYVAVEKVVVEEDDWYHRSFSVLNTGPFVIPPKKAKKVFVQFSPDFGMGIKRGTVLVFVKDRVEPVSFQIIGEVEERAVKLCRSVFGRSEKDLWIRYVLFTKKWGWTFYFLPVILFGLYLAFIRKWYTKRLKEEFLRRFSAHFNEERRKSDALTKQRFTSYGKAMDISSNDPRSRNTASTSRRKNRIREGANLREIIDTGQISPEQQPRTLRELIEREIPEDLRELCTVAYYASSPLTYIRHFHFPQRLWYRVFVILETIAWPTRSIIAVFCLIADWTCRAFGYELFSGKPSESELPLLVWKVADSSVRGICFWGTGWPGLSEWGLRERFLRIFTMGKLTRTSVQNGVSSVEQGHLENSTSLPSLPTSRNGRRSFDHQTNGDASCNGLLTTGKSRDPSKIDVKPVAPADTEENKPPSCDRLIGSPKQNLYKQKYSRVDADSPEPASSRDSSVGDDRNKSSDEPDRSGSAEAESSALKSARKLRRKQIQQTKREAEKAAKLARNYNKTQRRAEERKMIEAKTEEILAKDGNGKKAVVDSEPDVERERNLAAKRKAKLAVEKPIIRAVKPKAPETKPTSGSMPSTPGFHKTESSGPKFDFPCAQTRLAAHYPPQCDVIQQAFFRVEPKENGLMFTEMNRDQCLQLVKQLKRDNQNLFLLDPKVSVDLLLRSTRTSSYRIDGEYVSLARKSSVAAYANAGNRSSQEKRDSSSNWNKNYANPRGSERRTSPPNPWRNGNDVPSSTNFPRKSTSEEPFNPDHCWSGSLSPNESENGSLDFVRDREIRMSPLLMSYAGAAGNQSLSQKSSGDFAGQGNNAWRATPSPASVSLDTTAKEVLAGSRFAWEPKKSSDGDSVALKEKPDTSKSSMDKKLADYDDQLEETFGKQKGMFLGCNEQDFYGFVSKSGVEEEPRPRRNRGSIFDFSNDCSPEVSWPEEPFNDATFSASLWDTDSIWKSPSFTKASWTSHPSDTAMSSPWTSDTVNDSMTSMTYTAPKESGVSFWQDSIWSTSSFFQSAEVSDPKCPAGTDFQEAQKSLVPSKYTFGIIGAEIQEAKPTTDERYCTK